jgi:hypothetical protein
MGFLDISVPVPIPPYTILKNKKTKRGSSISFILEPKIPKILKSFKSPS